MSRCGFTLLEVMVALAILATALTAIFASEAGAVKVAHRARKMTGASLMARCKMGEIEELIAKEGLPAIEKSDTDHCCEGAELESANGHELFTCDWKIERIELPEMADLAEGEEGESSEGPSSLLDPTKLSDPNAVQNLLSGGGASGEGDAIAEMALSYAYPILKPVIEEQVRKATVTVKWNEGSRERSFSVMQFLVAEQPAAAPEGP